jgi:hypothetical protein
MAVEGATTARLFETYVEKVREGARAEPKTGTDRGDGQSLGAHRPKRIGELPDEERGCELSSTCRPTPRI